MGRDTNFKADAKPGRDVTQEDAFWQSEHGRDMSRVIDALQSGDEDAFDREYEQYRQKYNPPPIGSTRQGPERQAQPRPRPNLGPPMTLPPEAR